MTAVNSELGRLLLGASLLSFGGGCSSPDPGADALELEPVVAVKVARAELRDLALSIEAPATIHPRAVAQIAARVTAPIRSLAVGKGDRVHEGQVLAKLDDSDLQAQRVEAEATRQQAQVLYERRKALFEEGAIPERDLLTSRTDWEKAEARIELLRAQLAFTELVSPFPSVVTEQLLYPGDMARPDTPIFTVMDLSVAVARAQVPESEVPAVAIGESAVFRPAATEEGRYAGRITVVSATVDPARRTVEVWCEIPNTDGALHAGAFGWLRILTGTAPASVVVPSSALELEEGARRGSVLVIDEENVAHRREVVTGEGSAGLVPVVEGLAAGELVVIEGGYALEDGTRVSTELEELPR